MGTTFFVLSQNPNNINNANAATYPDYIVNGNFEYPPNLGGAGATASWCAITPQDGKYSTNGESAGGDSSWVSISGFNRSLFAWNSTQYYAVTAGQSKTNAVELQREDVTNNQYVELAASQAGTAIYQDISTVPGSVYRWTLSHTSITPAFTDKCSVMIGSQTSQSVSSAIRIQGTATEPDTGESTRSDVISTRVSNAGGRDHQGQWCVYTGAYLVPQNQTVTRFSFKNIASPAAISGNLLDNISFKIAYPLLYDLRGGRSDIIPQSLSQAQQNHYEGYIEKDTNSNRQNSFRRRRFTCNSQLP